LVDAENYAGYRRELPADHACIRFMHHKVVFAPTFSGLEPTILIWFAV
jgi:hypothetical protein